MVFLALRSSPSESASPDRRLHPSECIHHSESLWHQENPCSETIGKLHGNMKKTSFHAIATIIHFGDESASAFTELLCTSRQALGTCQTTATHRPKNITLVALTLYLLVTDTVLFQSPPPIRCCGPCIWKFTSILFAKL